MLVIAQNQVERDFLCKCIRLGRVEKVEHAPAVEAHATGNEADSFAEMGNRIFYRVAKYQLKLRS